MRSPTPPGGGPVAGRLPRGAAHADLIEQSHERSMALGVSRIERPDHHPLGRPDLAVARERNLRLHEHAAPVMEMLRDQIVHSQSMVVLTDATGTVLHSIGDDEFLERAAKVALRPGANWAESAKGTNAIGTALVEEVPTLVHADEHYLHANHFLTCSAAPILDPRGNILGVLDVTGDHRSYHQHTMALVKMSARMIENHWLSDDYRNVLRLHFHGRIEFIGTLMEGILAVSADGRLVGANRGALEQLGMSGAALRMHSLETLLGTTVGALVDRFRSPLATPTALRLADGRQFHAQARFNWPVWTSLAEAGRLMTPADAPVPDVRAMPSSRAMPAGGPALALARLCTGDPQVAAVVDKVRRVLGRGIPLLIVGETGTGKESLARALHADSPQGARPFLAVNCGALPGAQLEAELFGREADPGTLFLRDVGELPLPLQARLLHVLQQQPAGFTLVCATQRSLRELIDRGRFREDLYHRLAGLAVRLPPLRERGDGAALAQGILARESAGRRLELAAEVPPLLAHHPWPGNLRQLANVLRTACALAGDDGLITTQHLPDGFVEEASARLPPAAAAAPAADPSQTLGDMEIEVIRRAVEAAGGNISEASKRLGISRGTVYRKLRQGRPAP